MKNIALIYGGEGAERSISRASAKSIYELIDKDKYNVIPVFISYDGSWYISERTPFGSLPTLSARPTFPIRLHGVSGLLCGGDILRVDAAVPILHGDFGEDGVITGALKAAHIPFIGVGVPEGAICADKIYTKLVARALDIPTADFIIGEGSGHENIKRTLREIRDTLSFPVFIKPSRLGSSVGAMAVMSEDEFITKYTKTLSLGGRVLIERLINVDYEIECAMLSLSRERRFASGVIKTGGRVYDYDEKYGGRGIGCEIPPDKCDSILIAEEYASKIAGALGLWSMSRIDFLVDKRGVVYFNEINTLPGMTKTSLYPRLTEAMGLSRGEFINRLIAEAVYDGDI